MRKGFFGICLSLVVAIVLLAVFVPGCDPETKGSVWVKATLCGNPWTGFVDFELIPASGSPITGNNVPVLKAYVFEPGTWTCSYISGGPVGHIWILSHPQPRRVCPQVKLPTLL